MKATATVQSTATAAALALSQFIDRAERVNLRRLALQALRIARDTARALAEVLAALLVLAVVIFAKIVNPARRAIAWTLHTCSSAPRIYRAELRALDAVAGWMDRHPIATNTLLFALAFAFVLEVFFLHLSTN